MIGQIKSNREIATELQLSIKTVEAHRAHLRKKLHLTNGRELLRHALSRHLDEARVERDSSDTVQRPAINRVSANGQFRRGAGPERSAGRLPAGLPNERLGV